MESEQPSGGKNPLDADAGEPGATGAKAANEDEGDVDRSDKPKGAKLSGGSVMGIARDAQPWQLSPKAKLGPVSR